MLEKSIHSITPFTLLDYPNKSACILWYAGCNMQCLYCYNPEIVLGKGKIAFEEALLFLDKRKGLLDAVVFSGGECLIHKNIYNEIKRIKKLGFLIKIDTNGSNPGLLDKLIQENLINFVSLDYKATKNNFLKITQSKLFKKFEKSLELLLFSKIDFEVRTTYHSDLISNEDLNEMINYLHTKKYRGNYYIQFFRNNVETLVNLPHSRSISQGEIKDSDLIKIVFRD